MTNFIPFIDSLGFIQGLVLGSIIIILGRGKLASWFFGLFVITYAIELGDAILFEFGYIENTHRLAFAPLNFFFLNLPLLYLYLERIVGKFSWRTHIWWFLPGILEFSIFTTFFIFYAHFDKENFELILELYYFLSMVFYIVVALLIIYKTWGYQKILNQSHSSHNTSNLRWIIYICVFLVIYLLCFFYLEFQYNRTLYLSLITSNIIFIYLISILGIKQKHLEIEASDEPIPFESAVLRPNKTSSSGGKEMIRDNNLNTASAPAQEHTESSVCQEEGQENKSDQNVSLFNYLDNKIKEEKDFLDPEVNVFKLSRKFRLNSRRFSEIIKKQTGKSFRVYINTLRVNYAKSLIQNPNNDHLTMVSIGYDSGFQSKSAYYSSFKDVTNLTPIEFKNQVRNND